MLKEVIVLLPKFRRVMLGVKVLPHTVAEGEVIAVIPASFCKANALTHCKAAKAFIRQAPICTVLPVTAEALEYKQFTK